MRQKYIITASPVPRQLPAFFHKALSCCGNLPTLQSQVGKKSGISAIPVAVGLLPAATPELLMGLEPMTSSLPRKCSTTELQQLTSQSG